MVNKFQPNLKKAMFSEKEKRLVFDLQSKGGSSAIKMEVEVPNRKKINVNPPEIKDEHQQILFPFSVLQLFLVTVYSFIVSYCRNDYSLAEYGSLPLCNLLLKFLGSLELWGVALGFPSLLLEGILSPFLVKKQRHKVRIQGRSGKPTRIEWRVCVKLGEGLEQGGGGDR
ncbi:hypothetical protein Ccrd_009503 [Cynara cardunculus var. scolymus]|uniref:Uncharacterized protein n=1 Tax=Cynara cardunculus var. scolymus TaxID=59895 RepID=A0A103YMX5_CYNCS|nr:hypothetical protein Ccrd_009503 [Cynara cardunculus var. scolymus]